jgi:hypothetical protein
MLHEKASARELGLARIAVFGMWFGHVLMIPSQDMAAVPVDLLEPAGVLALLPGAVWSVLWTPSGLWSLKVILLVGLGATLLGTRRFHTVALATCLLLTLYHGMNCSFGYVNHAEIIPLYAAYILAVFPSADALSLFGPHRLANTLAVYRGALVAVTLVFLLTYSLVAVRRLCLSGPGIFVSDTILYQIAGGGVVPPACLGLKALETSWVIPLLRAGYPLVTLCELLAPLCLFSQAFRRLWKIVIVPFHIGTWLLMGIAFPMNLLFIAVFLTDLCGAFRICANRVALARPTCTSRPRRLLYGGSFVRAVRRMHRVRGSENPVSRSRPD